MVDMLLRALQNQPQLESIEFRLQSPEGERIQEIDSEDEPECFEEDVDDQAERMYRSAWESVNKLLEQNMRHNLR